LRLEAVYFHRDIEESIEWVAFGTFVQPVNTGDARARGLELGGSFAVLERLRLSASYTHLDTELRETGNDLPHSPRNQIFARADLPVGPVRVWGEYRYEDESQLNPALLRGVGSFSLTAPEVHQYDAGVSLRPSRVRGLGWLPDGITVSSEWINLTNEQRIDAFGLPLPDQTLWYLTLRGEFR
jgi:outer membrane receptor protein involved in Fe transport